MATIDVKDAAGATQTLERPLTPGQGTMAASRPVVIASNQSAVPISGTVTANAGTGSFTVTGSVNVGTVTTLPALVAGTANIGDVDVLTVPTDPFGANADAASVSGSVSAKLRALATAVGTGVITRGAGVSDSTTLRVSIASEQVEGGEYEAVPSTVSTTTTLGTTGAAGDFLSAVVITPLTTSPGSISIKDGSDTAILIFQGGATSVSNLVPFTVSIGASARNSGGWQVVTGSGGNVQALGIGNFT